MARICTVGDFCEQSGLPITPAELMQVLCDREVAKLAAHEARMARSAGRPAEQALPILEDGHEVGRLEARIPRELWGNLISRENFGWEGLTSDEGMKDILKAYPQCRVETVSGKVTSGWTAGSRKWHKNYGELKTKER